ncbi:TnsD family Tn7-like transposition protein [Bacillus paramycoides]|uniref:TnsD family Tn7-like transposition protein n=1 Tax=Bacillus paramycoides TaxID=2026194 RepID=UPI0011AA41BE|nr:TnsD family Tn7-like transposition protein [Bacillus paramycoides]
MICYFPTPYENELLYSIIARYHYHSGHKSKRETLLRLLGSDAKKFDVDAPSGVDLIVEKLKGISKGLTADYFIENHSILPFFRQFIESNYYHKVLLKVKGQPGVSYGTRIIREFDDDVKRKEHIYFCRKCLKDQFEMYGEGFWNRFHQVPGVLVCTKHKICLTKLPRYNLKKEFNKFIMPNINDVDSNVEEIQVSDKSFEILLDIAKDIEYLFSENLTVHPHQYYYDKYMELLKIHGICYPITKRKYLLAEKLLDFYPKEVLELFNSYLSPDNPLSWVRYITEKHRIRYLHPVRHILIMRLLCGSAREFYENNYIYQPFGSGPWICMNPLADHYLEKSVETLETNIHKAYRKLQGDFTCSCGFKYRLILPEQTPLEVTKFSIRIIDRGDLWDNEFHKLLSENVSITEISRSTVREIKKRIFSGKQNIYTRFKRRTNGPSVEDRTQKYKEEWEIIFKKNPNLNRTQLKALHPVVFYWIQKYDSAWLEKHMPPAEGGRKYTDNYYTKMDNKFLQAAQKVISNWASFEREKGGVQRITINSLCMQIGINRDLISKKGEKYPRLRTLVDSVLETREDFQKRRIKHLLDNKLSAEIVTVSKIKMLASLYKGPLVPEVHNYLEEQVKSHNRLQWGLEKE